ncbi:MAG: acetyl-CoA C-acetyltransferase, partial [Actinomycetota bacterium]|nr:acetyl-CoA C-acetyltransferase [Actinomycetota bacterium]
MLVGGGQLLRRADSAVGAPEPVAMMAEVARLAADDAQATGGAAGLLARIDSVRTTDTISWKYENAPALLSQELAVSPRQLLASTVGGNSPQMLVNDAAAAIRRGDLDVAVVAGAEAIYARLLARKEKSWLEWTSQDGSTLGPEMMGDDRPGTSEAEMARSLALPTQVYPIFENALRAAAGETVDEHQVKVSELWSRFSEVAAKNPYAWSPEARSADEIRTVTPENRMIGFPYPKLMNANIQTDQAAAVIVCSVEAARAAGVPEDRWVFVHAGADAQDHWWVSERADLHSSPAIGACGRAALDLAGVTIDEITHFDIYSCFPSAVQIACHELGVPLDRQLTVTGGLTFAGGPGNSYVNHSIATMVDVLRADPGTLGLVTALGWFITKHSIGIYSTEPPASGFAAAHPQHEVDASPRRALAVELDGDVTVESHTVIYDR